MAVPPKPASGGFTRKVFGLMPVLNTVLLLWAFFGRALFGALGFGVVIGVVGVPLGGLALTVTTLLARHQPAGASHRVLTVEATAQVVLWVALAVFGAAVVDNPGFVDVDHDDDVSGVIRVFGHGAAHASNLLAGRAAALALGAWLVLLVTLIGSRLARSVRA